MADVKAALPGAQRTPEGVLFKGMIIKPIVEKCEGCDRVVPFEEEKFCASYAVPASKWTRGICNFATHAKLDTGTGAKAKVNPLKASKRAARGR